VTCYRVRVLFVAALAALAALLGASVAQSAPDLALAVRDRQCVAARVADAGAPYLFVIVDRLRGDAVERSPVAYLDAGGAAVACFATPFAAGDFVRATFFRYDVYQSPEAVGLGWQAATPPNQVYLPMIAR
jgi:hypothetical protein